MTAVESSHAQVMHYTTWKYQNDPEFRCKHLERAKQTHYKRLSNDPEYREYVKAKKREAAQKYYSNPENRAKKNAYNAERYRRLAAERVQQDTIHA